MKLLHKAVYFLILQQLAFAQTFDQFSMSFKNDVLFKKDKDYSAGVELSYKNKNSDLTYYFGKDIYTPEDKESSLPLNGEHPYGAWLYIGASKQINIDDTIRNNIKISIGTVGQNAKGEFISNQLHKIIGASQENGWDTQVHKSVGYNVNVVTHFTKLIEEYNSTTIEPYLKINTGNLFLDLAAGIEINTKIDESFNIYADVQRKYVDKNIFLDGKSKKYGSLYAVEKIDYVNSLVIGLQTKYFKNYIWTLETVFNSKEYKTQASNNNYNMIKLSKRF